MSFQEYSLLRPQDFYTSTESLSSEFVTALPLQVDVDMEDSLSVRLLTLISSF